MHPVCAIKMKIDEVSAVLESFNVIPVSKLFFYRIIDVKFRGYLGRLGINQTERAVAINLIIYYRSENPS